jgi:uncharacterized membrane protein YkvA (DUF1232 family)
MSDDRILRYSTDGSFEEVPSRPRTRAELIKEAALAVPHLAKLLSRLMRDRDVPTTRKALAGAAMAYVVSPYDLFPDGIPFIGRIDDIVVLAAAVHSLMRAVPEERLDAYWEGSEDALDIVAGLIEWGADLVPGPLKRLISTPVGPTSPAQEASATTVGAAARGETSRRDDERRQGADRRRVIDLDIVGSSEDRRNYAEDDPLGVDRRSEDERRPKRDP